MSASGKKDVMSDAELEQRSLAGQAGTTHGAYVIRDHGVDAVPETKRSRVAELIKAVQTRAGVISLLQDRAVRHVLMCEVAESYVIERKSEGVPLDKISIFRALPGFQNSAQRALLDVFDKLHDDSNVIDASTILRDYDNDGND